MIPTVDIPGSWPIALALVGFGVVGLRRGWIRELASLGLVLLTWLVVVLVGDGLVATANKAALIFSFIWYDGVEAHDPAGLLDALRASPAIDPWQPELFFALLFLSGVTAAYLVASRLDSHPRSASESILGALAGGLNGFVISYVSLEYWYTSSSQVAGSGIAATAPLGGYLTTVAVAAVLAVVAIAMLASARPSPAKAKRSGRSGA